MNHYQSGDILKPNIIEEYYKRNPIRITTFWDNFYYGKLFVITRVEDYHGNLIYHVRSHNSEEKDFKYLDSLFRKYEDEI